jgi:hypothetical protein
MKAAASPLRASRNRIPSGKSRPIRNAIIAAVTGCCVLFATARAAHAQEIASSDSTFLSLKNYVARIGAGALQTARAAPGEHGSTFEALHESVLALHGNRAGPESGIKVAAADNMFDALRRFMQGHNGGTQSAPPASPQT